MGHVVYLFNLLLVPIYLSSIPLCDRLFYEFLQATCFHYMTLIHIDIE